MRTHSGSGLLIGAVLMAGICGAAGEAEAERVQVLVVEPAQRPVTEDIVGSVRPKLRSVIEGKVSGRITEMPAGLGQQVKSGDVLVVVDAQEVKARVEQAAAQREQAEKDLDRVRTLATRQVASRQDLDAAETRFRVAEAALSEAQTMMGYARVTAPFDGVIARKLAEVGDLATPGRALLEIEDRGSLRFEADIPEALIDMVSMGDRVQVTIPAMNAIHEAKVVQISPTADAASRTFLVKMDLPDSAGLRAGAFGRAAIPVGEATSIRVPVEAVVRRGQMEIIFVRREGKAQLRLVKSGKVFSDGVEILSGLGAGDEVILTGVSGLVDEQAVEVVK